MRAGARATVESKRGGAAPRIERSSGNVFEDLGLPDAAALLEWFMFRAFGFKQHSLVRGFRGGGGGAVDAPPLTMRLDPALHAMPQSRPAQQGATGSADRVEPTCVAQLEPTPLCGLTVRITRHPRMADS